MSDVYRGDEANVYVSAVLAIGDAARAHPARRSGEARPRVRAIAKTDHGRSVAEVVSGGRPYRVPRPRNGLLPAKSRGIQDRRPSDLPQRLIRSAGKRPGTRWHHPNFTP